jgi:hypothetical protein
MSQNSAHRKLGFAFKKILNGFSGRKSRFHTLDGRIAPLSDFLLLPIDGLLRVLRVPRTGPWISRAAKRELNRVLMDKYSGLARVLEIGGGRSTQWLRRRCAYLEVIEENLAWYKHIQAGPNLVHHGDALQVGKKVITDKMFDLIFIDGGTSDDRLELVELVYVVQPNCIIVLDDSDRSAYETLHHILSKKSMVRKWGILRRPLLTTQTTFWY